MTHLIWDQTIETAIFKSGATTDSSTQERGCPRTSILPLVRGLQPADYNTGDDSDHLGLLPTENRCWNMSDGITRSIHTSLSEQGIATADIAALKANLSFHWRINRAPSHLCWETNVIPTKSNQYGYVSDNLPQNRFITTQHGAETDIIPAGAAGRRIFSTDDR